MFRLLFIAIFQGAFIHRWNNPWTGLDRPRGAPRISVQSPHEGGKVVSHKHWSSFSPQGIFLVLISVRGHQHILNPLSPNDPYSGRTAPLTSKFCILYIYSTNICTEYFKHGIYSPFFFSLQNAVCFMILTYLVPVLFTFYKQCVLKFKKK